jgi:hypothetical protein
MGMRLKALSDHYGLVFLVTSLHQELLIRTKDVPVSQKVPKDFGVCVRNCSQRPNTRTKQFPDTLIYKGIRNSVLRMRQRPNTGTKHT